jgi:hypothetical protein
MASRNSKIEPRSTFVDVAELEEPNKSDPLVVINDPEAGDVRTREVNRAYLAMSQPALTVEGPLVVAEELDELVVVVRDLHASELDRHVRDPTTVARIGDTDCGIGRSRSQ